VCIQNSTQATQYCSLAVINLNSETLMLCIFGNIFYTFVGAIVSKF